MATTQKLNLTRDQLATFLKNFEQIKQFEKLFAVADEVAPASDTTGISINAGNASAEANEALAQIVRLSKDAAINAGNADQKAIQALDTLGCIAKALDLLSTAPVIENNNSTATDYIDLNTADFVSRIRRLGWDETDQTLNIGMDYGVTQQVGQEVYARVGNTTGSTIPNGSVVGFAGATANALLVAPYLADGTSPSLYILGVMTHDLPDSGEKGYCTTWGFVRDLDTSAFSAGDILYASPTTAGALTNVKPTAPDNVIPLAACIVSDASAGVIFVRPTIEQMKYYGVFTKTTDQTPALVNTEYLLTFDNTQISNGVTIGTPTSRIVVPESGLYKFDATFQITDTGIVTKNVWLWMKKNGTAIPNSARIVSVNLGYGTATISESVSMAANDYVEFAFAASNTNVTIDNVAPTAFAPDAPAIVLSVTQVQQ
jgi:hypothetical protein